MSHKKNPPFPSKVSLSSPLSIAWLVSQVTNNNTSCAICETLLSNLWHANGSIGAAAVVQSCSGQCISCSRNHPVHGDIQPPIPSVTHNTIFSTQLTLIPTSTSLWLLTLLCVLTPTAARPKRAHQLCEMKYLGNPNTRERGHCSIKEIVTKNMVARYRS